MSFLDFTVLRDVLEYGQLLLFKGNRVQQDIGHEDIYPRPVLLIHGFMGTRAVMLPIEHFLRKEGSEVFSIALGIINTNDIRQSAFKIHQAIERLCYDLDIQEIDIIAHSMGGLIGLYYIKKLGGNRRVRRMITMGTPYIGTPAAWAGVLTIGAVSTATWQMVPNSFFLQELHTGNIPDDVEVYAIEARHDVLVPKSAAEIPDIKVIYVKYGHTSLIFSEEVHEKIREILTL